MSARSGRAGCRSDSPLASPAGLRSELHIPAEIRAPLKIKVIDTHQRRAADERHQRFPFIPMAVVVLSRNHDRNRLTVGGELLGLLLSPFHQLGEMSLGFLDRPALNPFRAIMTIFSHEA